MTDQYTIPARRTIYNGIPMRSRLEARYAAWLDRQHIHWDYEPNAFASPDGQYLPDFRLHDIGILAGRRTVYVEVKPGPEHFSRAVIDQTLIIFDSEPDACLLLEAAGAAPQLWFGAELTQRQQPAGMRVTWIATGDGMALTPHVREWWC
jgi:hypothetical protein